MALLDLIGHENLSGYDNKKNMGNGQGMKFYLYVIFALILFSCQSLDFPTEEIITQRNELREKRSPADGAWTKADELFDSYYLECLGDDINATYYPIWFKSLDDKMNGIIFKPGSNSKGTILMIHGYAGNIKGFRVMISRFLREGYTVAALSLPGHGLAGGERGDIDNFNDYGILVRDFLKSIRGKVPEPMFAVSHSTGCSALIIHNQKYSWKFRKVVFIAPLVRSYSWHLSVVGRVLTKPFVNYYNTPWTGVLAVHVFPMHWFDELYDWNKSVEGYKKQSDDLLVFQGEKDKVVSWEYNVDYLKRKYRNSNFIYYPDADHTYFMYEGDNLEDTITRTLDFFE